jgi:hypothetical protein
MEEGRPGGGEGRACRVARHGLSGLAGLLRRTLCRPRSVTEGLGPLAAIRERLRSVDRLSWALIVRALTFEERQCGRAHAAA